jgi:hypothetical protein
MAFRAFAMSRAGAEALEASSPSTSRRPRDGMEERMALRKSGSVPRSPMTTMSIEARSNRSARARSLSFGRSAKENSIVLRMAASFGRALPIALMTSSASSGSRLLMMPAIRERRSAPPLGAIVVLVNIARSAASTTRSASRVTSHGATSPHRAAFRRSRGSAPAILAASWESSFERM